MKIEISFTEAQQVMMTRFLAMQRYSDSFYVTITKDFEFIITGFHYCFACKPAFNCEFLEDYSISVGNPSFFKILKDLRTIHFEVERTELRETLAFYHENKLLCVANVLKRVINPVRLLEKTKSLKIKDWSFILCLEGMLRLNVKRCFLWKHEDEILTISKRDFSTSISTKVEEDHFLYKHFVLIESLTYPENEKVKPLKYVNIYNWTSALAKLRKRGLFEEDYAFLGLGKKLFYLGV